MENQINSVQVAVENFTKKKRRCNSAAWLQIFGAIGAVGGDIAIKVASGLLSKVSGICVAIGGIGMSIFVFFKDKRSCLKCCPGTSYMDDIIYENEQNENKYGPRIQACEVFVDQIKAQQDEDHNKVSEANLQTLGEIETNLRIHYSKSVENLLEKIKEIKIQHNSGLQSKFDKNEISGEEQIK